MVTKRDGAIPFLDRDSRLTKINKHGIDDNLRGRQSRDVGGKYLES